MIDEEKNTAGEEGKDESDTEQSTEGEEE